MNPGTPAFAELASRHDVLIAQYLPGSVLAKLIGTPLRLVLDLYDPRALEVLERHGELAPTELDRQAGAEAADSLRISPPRTSRSAPASASATSGWDR